MHIKAHQKRIDELKTALDNAHPGHPFRVKQHSRSAQFSITLPGECRNEHEIQITLDVNGQVRILSAMQQISPEIWPQVLPLINHYNCATDTANYTSGRTISFTPGQFCISRRTMESERKSSIRSHVFIRNSAIATDCASEGET